MKNNNTKIAVAISGGFDSFCAAYYLKKQNHNLIAVHFSNGYITDKDLPKAIEVFETWGIKTYIADLKKEFDDYVIKYFVKEYFEGKTPNPCVVCNQKIKFDLLLKFAEKLGAGKIATGHYVRIIQDKKKTYKILKGSDSKKDQSYFLSLISPNILSKTIFPLGSFLKEDLKKALWEKYSKHFYNKKESQDICFIRDGNLNNFLEKQFGKKQEKGAIRNTKGELIGEHNGLYNFTIGKRKGINCPSSEAYYVLEMHLDKNEIIVGYKGELFKKKFIVSNLNIFNEKIKKMSTVNVKIRYAHRESEAKIDFIDEDKNRVKIDFKEPQFAITKGQTAAFYDNDELLAGGWID